MTSNGHTRQRAFALAASSLLTAAGGALDAWVYLAHGHAFANAQSGNIVLMTISLANADFAHAGNHVTSLIAFIAGLFVSQQVGRYLKQMRLNSRDIRLGVECLLLTALGLVADGLSDHTVIAYVGFIAGVQITSLSHFGAWSFNTGMTTGNLRGAVGAASKALAGSDEERAHALVLAALCAAFVAGALAGAWLTPRLKGLTLLPVTAFVAAAIAAAPRGLDPIPGWKDLQ